MVRLAELRRAIARPLTKPLARLLAKVSLSPDAVTWTGFWLSVGAVALIITHHLAAAGAVVLVAGFCDMLDGALARYLDRASRFGAILDSTLDRVSEALLLLGILYLYVVEAVVLPAMLVGVALVVSQLVSYVRARAEAMGVECQVGLFTRPERVIVLALGLLLSNLAGAMVMALAIIALFSCITMGQRLYYVWRQVNAVS